MLLAGLADQIQVLKVEDNFTCDHAAKLVRRCRVLSEMHERPENAELAIEIRNINRSHSLLAERNFITFISLSENGTACTSFSFMQTDYYVFLV